MVTFSSLVLLFLQRIPLRFDKEQRSWILERDLPVSELIINVYKIVIKYLDYVFRVSQTPVLLPRWDWTEKQELLPWGTNNKLEATSIQNVIRYCIVITYEALNSRLTSTSSILHLDAHWLEYSMSSAEPSVMREFNLVLHLTYFSAQSSEISIMQYTLILRPNQKPRLGVP